MKGKSRRTRYSPRVPLAHYAGKYQRVRVESGRSFVRSLKMGPLLVAVAVCVLFALFGTALVGESLGSWYGALEKPWFLIPVWTFGIVDPSNLRNRSLKALLRRAGLPSIRFHDLRHTCATLLLSRNVNPKIVSEMLGHASIAITLDTYSHVLPNMQRSAVRALEQTLK